MTLPRSAVFRCIHAAACQLTMPHALDQPRHAHECPSCRLLLLLVTCAASNLGQQRYGPKIACEITLASHQLQNALTCTCACQDLVIPSFLGPSTVKESPLLGFPARQRSHLAFFLGNVGHDRLAHYSRSLRQRLYFLARSRRWRERFGMVVGTREDLQEGETYEQMLSSSKFCLVLPGAPMHGASVVGQEAVGQCLRGGEASFGRQQNS